MSGIAFLIIDEDERRAQMLEREAYARARKEIPKLVGRDNALGEKLFALWQEASFAGNPADYLARAKKELGRE